MAAPPPLRVVSLVPSMTETVYALGAGDRLVGVTRFCVHPREARERAGVVGGTKNPSIAKVLSLQPDLVLANQEENRREDVERLKEAVPVHLAFPRDLGEAVVDVRALGSILGSPAEGERLAREIEEAWRALPKTPREFRYLYFIWKRPYMVAGPGTFLESLMAEIGGMNAAPRDRGRYPELGIEDVRRSTADVLLLSSEPFPFGKEHRTALAAELGFASAEADRIQLVDGELLSWHGARLREGLPYLGALSQRLGL